jgi:hypothetical protein
MIMIRNTQDLATQLVNQAWDDIIIIIVVVVLYIVGV